MAPPPANLLINGDFNSGGPNGGFSLNGNSWGQGSGSASGSIPGWNITQSPTSTTGATTLERVGDGHRNANSPTDSLIVDLEGNPGGNVQISQTVTLAANQHYALSFEIGQAFDATQGDASALLQVLWNGVPVAGSPFNPDPNGMQTINILVQGSPTGSNTLTFAEISSPGDSTGSYIANVQLLPATFIVDEDALTTPGGVGAGHETGPGDIAGIGLTASGGLGIDWGADAGAARNVTFDPALDGMTSAYQSRGKAIVYEVDTSGRVLTAMADGRTIFVVTLDPATASFNFELRGNIDHPVNSGEDNLPFTFGFVANDSDRDTAHGSFTVLVNDDSPVANAGDIVTVPEDNVTGGNVITNPSGADHLGADGATLTWITFNPEGTPPAWRGIAQTGGPTTLPGPGGAYTFQPDGAWTFTPTPNYNGQAGFSYIITDGDGDESDPHLALSNPVVINVTAINDTPVNSVPGAQSVHEDTNLVFSTANGNAVSISDVDAGSGDVRVTISVQHGSLTLSTVAGLDVTAGADGSGSMTIVGSINDINAALNGLTYRGNADYFGPDSLSIVTNDLGNTGNEPGASGDGNSEEDSDSVAITVTPVNDAPVLGPIVSNGGFEDNTTYAVSGTEGRYTQAAPSGWTIAGPNTGGWFDPAPAGAGSSNAVLPMETANGVNVLFLNEGKSASQVLEAKAAVGTYTLQFDVGERVGGSYTGMPAFRVELLASDGTVIGTGINPHSTTDNPYAWRTFTLTAAVAPGSAALDKPLKIVFTNLEDTGPGTSNFPAQAQINLDNVRLAFSPRLPTINEDATNDAGVSVASIVGDTISDVDAGAVEGIAVFAQDDGNGTWQYFNTTTATWSSFGSVSETGALLLRSSDLVRFVPDGNNGTQATFEYYAWDRTSGTEFGLENVSAGNRGGTTAFSLTSGEAYIIVTPVNDAPVAPASFAGSVFELGDISGIDEAGQTRPFEPIGSLNHDAEIKALFDGGTSVQSVLLALQGGTFGHTKPQAFAILWDYLDEKYGLNHSNPTVNEAFVRLGIEYGYYLKDGGAPFTEVVAKFSGTRNQSLHDNLLGNLTDSPLTSRFDEQLSGSLKQAVDDIGFATSLRFRDYFEGGLSEDYSDERAYDYENDIAGRASGTLSATDVDMPANTLTWGPASAESDLGYLTVNANGNWVYELKPGAANNFGVGHSTTESFPVSVSDGKGGTGTTTLVITIHGSNDAPVITGSTPTAYVAPEIIGFTEAQNNIDVQSGLGNFEPLVARDGDIVAALATYGSNMDGALTALSANRAEAIALMWDYLDDGYVAGPADPGRNEAFVRLGIEYAKYLQAGNPPLTSTTAKYTPDDPSDPGATPEREQSMHDNLLGNLRYGPMSGRWANDLAKLSILIDAIQNAGAGDLLGRPLYEGYESNVNTSIAWDQQHGYLPLQTGQLTATDVDIGDVVAFSILPGSPAATYGTFVVNPDGSWTYTLSHNAAFTALPVGQVTDSITVQASDGEGGYDTHTLSVSFTGQNDLPVIVAGPSAASTPEDTAVSLAGLSIADADSNAEVVAATLTVTGGQLLDTANNAQAATLTFTTLTVAQLNAKIAAGELLFVPTPDYDGAGQLRVVLAQGGVTGESQTFVIDITPVNDAPVYGPVATASITESGDLAGIAEAGPAGLFAAQSLSSATLSELAALPSNPSSVALIVANIAAEIGGANGTARAIAIVWDHLDNAYVDASPLQKDNINEAMVRLGVEYAKYVKAGGTPLIDVTAKFEADTVADADTTPDRNQTLHDNLLGNLNGYVIEGRFADPLETELKNLVSSVEPNLLTRVVSHGYDNAGDIVDLATGRAWDITNGFVAKVTGQVGATDVDTGATLTFSGNAVGTYGSFTVDSVTGKWTYLLDNYDPDTQALAEGQTGVETFTVTVTDEHDASDALDVVINVNGANDLNPILLYSADPENGGVFIGGFTSAQAAVDASADGNFIALPPGTITENVIINGKNITIDGAGRAANGTELVGSILVTGDIDGKITFRDFAIDAAGRDQGIYVTSHSTGNGEVVVDNVLIENARINGFSYIRQGNGSTPTLSDTIGAVAIVNSEFAGNATQNSGPNGRGDILLYGFNGDLTINNVSIHDPAAGAQKAIQVRGHQDGEDEENAGPYDPAGRVAINNLSVVGAYANEAIAFYRIADFESFTGSGNSVAITRGASASSNATLEPWAVINFDEVGGDVDLTGFFASASNMASPDGNIPAVPGWTAQLQGLATADELTGTGGMDLLDGRGGADWLDGGNGNDVLIGGIGGDNLKGGADVDLFRWNSGDLAGDAIDYIADLETGDNADILDLSGLLGDWGTSDHEAHVRINYGNDTYHVLSSNDPPPDNAGNDVTLQVETADGWKNVATLHDSGTNLTSGGDIVKFILDGTTVISEEI